MTDVPRNTGRDADGIAETEADHFMKCQDCDQWFDMRDLGLTDRNGPMPRSA